MRVFVFAIAMLAAAPALAKDLTITLTDKEQQALLALVDAGVKTLGIQGVGTAVMVINKLREANGPAPASSPSPTPPADAKKE